MLRRRVFAASAPLRSSRCPRPGAGNRSRSAWSPRLSGQSARAGEAITRGLQVAIDEINAKGGVLGGRKFELVRRDDEATRPRA